MNDSPPSFSTEELTRKLIAYIMSDVLLDSSQFELAANDDLLEDGLVDSLGIMKLLAYIESEFGFAVPAQDFTVETFMSVDAIVVYLEPNV